MYGTYRMGQKMQLVKARNYQLLENWKRGKTKYRKSSHEYKVGDNLKDVKNNNLRHNY